jgi:hypothetical protein
MTGPVSLSKHTALTFSYCLLKHAGMQGKDLAEQSEVRLCADGHSLSSESTFCYVAVNQLFILTCC